MASRRVEVDPGGRGETELVEPGRAQRLAVSRAPRLDQMINAGPHVEGAVGRSEVVETGSSQTIEHNRAIRRIAGNVGLTLIVTVECAIAPSCERVGAEIVTFWPIRVSDSRRSSGITNHPNRHPVIEKYFEKLLITIASGSNCNAVGAGSPYDRP